MKFVQLILWPMAILPWIASGILARNGHWRLAAYWLLIGGINFIAKGL